MKNEGREGGTCDSAFIRECVSATVRVTYLVHADLQRAMLALHLQKGGNKKCENKGWEGGRYVRLSHHHRKSPNNLPGAGPPTACAGCFAPEQIK